MAIPTSGKLGFVTVMDVDVYTPNTGGTTGDPEYITVGSKIECLTISNITQEGPRKELRGGRNAEPCVRYGKTMRLEMEDAVMRQDLLETLFGATVETGTISFTEKFPKGIILVGKTEVVDQSDGSTNSVEVVFHNFLPDAVTDITMESEGDIGVISIAGELFSNSNNDFFTIQDEGEFVANMGTLA